MTDAQRLDAELDAQTSARRHLALVRLDLDPEFGGSDWAQARVAGGASVAVSHLGFDRQDLTARDPKRAILAASEHLEAGRAHPRDAELRDGARHTQPEQDRAGPGHDRAA